MPIINPIGIAITSAYTYPRRLSRTVYHIFPNRLFSVISPGIHLSTSTGFGRIFGEMIFPDMVRRYQSTRSTRPPITHVRIVALFEMVPPKENSSFILFNLEDEVDFTPLHLLYFLLITQI